MILRGDIVKLMYVCTSTYTQQSLTIVEMPFLSFLSSSLGWLGMYILRNVVTRNAVNFIPTAMITHRCINQQTKENLSQSWTGWWFEPL